MTDKLGPSPRAMRASLHTSADIRIGMSRGSVEVLDISQTGVKIRALNPLTDGTHLWLKLPNLQALEIEVVWYDGFEAGCRFVNPLHPAVFEALAQRGH